MENAENWVRNGLSIGQRLMGFGHRIYKTEDPRAEELRALARLADPQEFALARRVEELALALLEEQKPGHFAQFLGAWVLRLIDTMPKAHQAFAVRQRLAYPLFSTLLRPNRAQHILHLRGRSTVQRPLERANRCHNR